MQVRVKCYAIYEADREIISEYETPSQRNFLVFELRGVLKRLKRGISIDFERTTNGCWYSKHSQQTHYVLFAEDSASMAQASSLLRRGIEFSQRNLSGDKLKMKISQQLKVINANGKVSSLSKNVVELEGMMKSNVSKMIGNIGDLHNVERKSEAVLSLSEQFENDSKRLQDKIKRQQCLRKMVVAGLLLLLIIFLCYYFAM